MRKNSILYSSLLFSLCVGTALGVSSTPAHAGFQWVPPLEGADAPSVIVPGAPSAQGPVIIEGSKAVLIEGKDAPTSEGRVLIPPPGAEPVAATPAPALQPAPLNVLAAPGTGPVDKTLTAPATASEASAPLAADAKPVVGFATRVPLAVALRQILPTEYGYSFDGDVTLGTLVSWKGGKAWREVLTDMLAPVGYAVREQGMMIRIVKGAEAPSGKGTVPAKTAKNFGDDHVLRLPEGLESSSKPVMPMDVPSSIPDMAPAISGGAIVDTWVASRGDMLRKTLSDWALRARVDVNWLAEYDYPILASVTLSGSFEDAVRNLLVGFEEAKPQPIARLYNNPASGQSVLIVETRGNNYGS